MKCLKSFCKDYLIIVWNNSIKIIGRLIFLNINPDLIVNKCLYFKYKAINQNYLTFVLKFIRCLPVSVLSLIAEALKISNNATNTTEIIFIC